MHYLQTPSSAARRWLARGSLWHGSESRRDRVQSRAVLHTTFNEWFLVTPASRVRSCQKPRVCFTWNHSCFYTPTSRHWNLSIEETSAASPTHQKSSQLRVNLCMVAAVLLPASSYKLNSCQVLGSSIVACGSI